MNPIEETLNRWKKLCMRKNLIPVALITMTEDGIPHVFTPHDEKMMRKVYQHLLNDNNPTETKVPIINEN